MNNNYEAKKFKAFYAGGVIGLFLAFLLAVPWALFHGYMYRHFQISPIIDSSLSIEEKALTTLANLTIQVYVIQLSISVLAIAYIFLKVYELFVANDKDL